MKKTKLPIIVSTILILIFWFFSAIILNAEFYGTWNSYDIDYLLWLHNTKLVLVWLAILLVTFFLKEDKRYILNAYLIKPVSWVLSLHIFLNFTHHIKAPSLIFVGIAVLVVVYWLKRGIFKKGQLSARKKMTTLLISFLVLSFSWVWFVPMDLGIKDDIPFCKFRFQVLVCDSHDYGGHGNIQDFFIQQTPSKYGMWVFYGKIGGWREYFGLKKINYPSRQEYFKKNKNRRY